MSKTTVKIAAMGDIHMQQTNIGIYKETFTKISQEADVLVLCGDLTDHGHPEEAEMLAQELTFCKIPVVGVLGNHDFESGKQDEVRKILSPKAMFLLDDEPFEVAGIGFAGTKGFGGGFGTHMLGYFGESGMKTLSKKCSMSHSN